MLQPQTSNDDYTFPSEINNIHAPTSFPTMTTFESTSSGHSSSASKHSLDPSSQNSLFVYKVRSGASILTEAELCAKLESDPTFSGCRWSSMPIPRGASRVAVRTQDLWTEDERARYKQYPNASSSIASVGLPREVYWRRMLMGHFPNLYIVSPDNSPNSSQDNSPDESRHVTPSNTFKTEPEVAPTV